MYHDFRSILRDAWRFEYTADELLGFAEKKLAEYAGREYASRDLVSSLMRDRTLSRNDEKIKRAENEADTAGPIHEQLRVWVHEFRRNPDKTHILSLGDVVFFGIVESPAATEEGAS